MRSFFSSLAFALSFLSVPAWAGVERNERWILPTTPRSNGPVHTMVPLRTYRPRPVADTTSDPLAAYPVENRPEAEALYKEIRSLVMMDDADFRWQAFHYANSPQGMHWSWSAAKDWADTLTTLSRFERARRLVLHRKAFQYANGKDGLDWGQEPARVFADNVSKRADGMAFVILHRKAFDYANRDRDGLKWDWLSAKVFADGLSARRDGFRALELHRQAFRYASTTLHLDWGAAKSYADEKAGLR